MKIPNKMLDEIAALTRQGRRQYFRNVQKNLKYSDEQMRLLESYIALQLRKLDSEPARKD